MTSNFKGFKTKDQGVPEEPDSAENSDSSAGVSEYESTVNSGSNPPLRPQQPVQHHQELLEQHQGM